LFNTKVKTHFSNGFFLALNIFHLFLASAVTISPKNDGLIRFSFFWLQQFQWRKLLLAVVLLCIQIIISYLIAWHRFRQAKLTQINELGFVGENHLQIKKNLRLNPNEIHAMVHELAQEFKIKSIKRVYLSDTNIPNAMTIDILPLPFLRCSWIVLDANVIEILDKNEIKAIIAHELSHIKKFDSIVNIYRFGINYFVFIAYSLQLLQMLYFIIADKPEVWNIILRIALFLIIVLAIWLLTIINRLLMNYSRRQAEFLADYTAGRLIGRNVIINALMVLGQRIDVITAFGIEFKWLGRREGKKDVTREFLQGIKDLSPKELSKDISRQKALYIYVAQRLKNLHEDLLVPITEEEIDKLAKKACQQLLILREKELQSLMTNNRHLSEKQSYQTINWETVETEDEQIMSDKAIEHLIAMIKENPEKELFVADLQLRQSFLPINHPTIRSRILFLYETLK